MALGDWIKVHRAMMDHAIWPNEWLVKLFLWCIFKANYQEGNHLGTPVKRGQFITGRFTAAEELGVNPSRWVRGMERLEFLGCISLEPNTKWTLVTVCNYETYQEALSDDRTLSEQQTNNKRTLEKEGKKGRNNKAAAPPVFEIPQTLQDERFIAAWGTWMAHLKEKRKPLGQIAGNQQLKKMEAIGLVRALAALEHSTSNNYTGIYEPSTAGNSNGKRFERPEPQYENLTEKRQREREERERRRQSTGNAH